MATQRDDKPIRTPRNVAQATALLERIAQLDAETVHINAIRDKAIADSNAVADQLLVPVLERRAAIAALVEPWWQANGAQLLPKGRKTMELGGCTIGTKAASIALTFTGDDKAAVAALDAHRWAKPYVKVTLSVDKIATKKALDGKHGDQLRALGFGLSKATDAFVVDAVKQTGTAA